MKETLVNPSKTRATLFLLSACILLVTTTPVWRSDAAKIPFDAGVRLTRTDVSTALNEAGAGCTIVNYSWPLAFYNTTADENQYMTIERSYEDPVVFITPNHLGKKQTDPIIATGAYFTPLSPTQGEICLKHAAVLGNQTEQSFDETSVDMLVVSHELFGSRVVQIKKHEFGCSSFDIGVKSAAKPVIIVSLLHPRDYHYHAHNRSQIHDEFVWLKNYLYQEGLVNICWKAYQEFSLKSHEPVVINLLIIPTDAPLVDTRTNKSIPRPLAADDVVRQKDYEVGVKSVYWPKHDESQGVCVEFPFSEEHSFTPFAFASAELVSKYDEEDPLFVWIESINESGMEVCVVDLRNETSEERNDVQLNLHYLIVEQAQSIQQNMRSQTGYARLNLYSYGSASIPINPLEDAFFVNTTISWIAEMGGVSTSQVSLHEVGLSYYLTAIYFNILHSENPQSVLQHIKEYIEKTMKEYDYRPTLKEDQSNKFEVAFYEAYKPLPEFKISMTLEYGFYCRRSRFFPNPCSATEYGVGGTQRLKVAINSAGFSSGEYPQYTEICETQSSHFACKMGQKYTEEKIKFFMNTSSNMIEETGVSNEVFAGMSIAVIVVVALAFHFIS